MHGRAPPALWLIAPSASSRGASWDGGDAYVDQLTFTGGGATLAFGEFTSRLGVADIAPERLRRGLCALPNRGLMRADWRAPLGDQPSPPTCVPGH